MPATTPAAVTVLRSGPLTTIQDWPGRVGYWKVGVPPSGPMDDLSFRLANLAVGNPETAAGLEITLMGPALRFERTAVVARTRGPGWAARKRGAVAAGGSVWVGGGGGVGKGAS
ncbi:urea amidolyase, partial [Gordonia sp. NPDC058843]